jgi:serine/threonine-protein kinase
MAPEQAKGQPFDKRGDIYAVGCILYEMLAGRPPFSAGNYNALLAAILEAKPTPLEQLRPDLPGTLCRIVTKAMNKAARARYQSPQEMSAELAKRSRVPKLTLPPASDPLESAPTIAVHPIRSVKPRRSPKK